MRRTAQITLYSGCSSPEVNRSSRNGSMSTVEARPSTISSAMSSPATGPCMNPWPENPAITWKPSTSATRPRIGCASGVTSYRPAQLVRNPASPRRGNRRTAASTCRASHSWSTSSLNPGLSLLLDCPVRMPGPSRWKYSESAKKITNGKSGRRSGIGAVTTTWRRIGSIGMSTPTIFPSSGAQAPQALTTTGVSIEHAREVELGDQLRAVRVLEPPRVDPQPVLEGHVVAEGGEVLIAGQQEQVAAELQADVLPELLGEPLQHPDALDRQPDVDLRGELMTDAPGAATRRHLAEERLPLQQHHVLHAPCREVVRRAGAHHAATDHHGVGRPRKVRAHRDIVSEARRPRSAWSMAQAALIRPMWLNPWGKFPSSSPVEVFTSSARRPTSFACRTARSNTSRARPISPASAHACASQNVHNRNVPSSPASPSGP